MKAPSYQLDVTCRHASLIQVPKDFNLTFARSGICDGIYLVISVVGVATKHKHEVSAVCI